MERRLVVPYFGIELVSMRTKRGFGQFKTFVRPDLNGGAHRQQRLKQTEREQQDSQPGDCLGPIPAPVEGEYLTFHFADITFSTFHHQILRKL
jgi:hypothetical protein